MSHTYLARLIAAFAFGVLSWIRPALAAEAEIGLAHVRQVPAINGGATVEGSIHMMSAGSVTLNGGATITGDLLVPGTPVVRINGKPNFGGTLDGSGPASPSSYTITLNGQATLRNVIRRTLPLALPAVTAPPAPSGARNVTLNFAAQPVGDWATLRNLTLNGNTGQIAVPPGTYGDFIANGGSGFTLGIGGATTPAVYNLQRLTLNGQARIDVVGPVVLNLANGLAANGALGSSTRPDWLALNIAAGGLTLNGGCTIHAFVNASTAGSGTVLINGNSTLVGGLIADRLIVNGGGLLRLRSGGGGTGPVNTAPVAASQSLSTPEDTPLALTLTASDAENDPLGYFLVSPPEAGALTFADGSPLPALGSALSSTALRYAPAANATEPVSFTFRVRDAAGLESNLATVSIAITPVNDVPVAAPLVVRTAEDTPVALTLSGSDLDGSIVAYSVDAVTSSGAPLEGSLTGEPPALTYHPKADFFGEETFSYTVTDDQGGVSPRVSVTITVDPVNDVPVAQPRAIELIEDEPVLITLAATDAENQPLRHALASLPISGVLTLADGSEIPAVGQLLPLEAGGVVRYVPGPNYNGADVFTFTATDGADVSVAAAIHLAISPKNDAPVARPGDVATDEDKPVVITLSASDIDGDELVYSVASPPSRGSVSIAGRLATYVPAADYFGEDSFAFIAHDGSANSPPAVVAILVAPKNDAPVAQPPAASTTPEDMPLQLTLGGTDADSGDALTYTITTGPGHGALGGTAPALTYTPASDYHGPDSFAYTVSDSAGGVSAPVQVSILVTPVNDTPVAENAAYVVSERQTLPLVLRGTDADGDALTYAITLSPAVGAISGDAPELVYTPPANTNTTVELAFTVSDGIAVSAPATIGIEVRNVPDAPIAESRTFTLAEDTSLALVLAATDPEGDALGYEVIVPPAHGMLSGDAPTPTYTPDANFHGTDTFTFIARDSSLESAPAVVSLIVTPVNDAPRAAARSFTTPEDTPLPITLGGLDDDGDTLTCALTSMPTHGTLTFADGSPLPTLGSSLPSGAALLYTPSGDYHGADGFAYTVADSAGAVSAPALIEIAVSPRNDAPTAVARSLSTMEDAALELTLSGADRDGDALTYVVVTPPAHGSLTGAAPALVYTPYANYHGTDSFAFVTRDAEADSAPALIELVVTPANDAPTTADQSFALVEDQPGTLTLQATDADGDELEFSLRPASGNVITAWNALALDAVRLASRPVAQGGSGAAPPEISRALAIAQLAVFEAVNAVDRDYAPYDSAYLAASGPVSLEIAAARAAHDALAALFPASAPLFASRLAQDLAAEPDAEKRTNGSVLGAAAAARMLALRSADGAFAPSSYTPRPPGTIGAWQPADVSLWGTPNGGALRPEWGSVTPFVLAASNQFAPPAPPAVGSPEYAAAYSEVKTLGASTSPVRSADQTQTAYYWADGPGTYSPPGHWNAIASRVAARSDLSLVATARLLALVNLANADAAIACWQSKFAHDYWRPVTAVRFPDDANPLTESDPVWSPLLGTPQFPSYPSGHSTFSAASATVLAGILGDAIRITVPSEDSRAAPRVVNSLAAAALEAGRSRVLAGIHYEFDNTAGRDLGRSIGEYVLTHALQPVEPEPAPEIQRGEAALAGAVLSYTPPADYHGSDVVPFSVSDGQASASARVRIALSPVNDLPVARSQAVALLEDTSAQVLLSASDADGEALAFAITAPPAHGTLTGVPPALVYTPDANYAGPDAFAFTASDTDSVSAPAEVQLTVLSVNDAPIAAPSSVSTPHYTPVLIDLGGSDADGDVLTFISVSSPIHGVLTLPDGSPLPGSGRLPPTVRYQPRYAFWGQDTFSFKASDGRLVSPDAVVGIDVVAPAVAVEPIVSLEPVTPAPLPHTAFALRATALDADGAVARVEFYEGASLLGALTREEPGEPGVYAFLLSSGRAPGTYVFTAKVFDDQGLSSVSGPLSITLAFDPRARTYTTSADFQEGEIRTLKSENDELTTSFFPAAYDFVWVVNSSKGTVVRLDSETARVVGEYRASAGAGSAFPSRIAIDSRGNAFVANRQTGEIVKIGLGLDNGVWIDRDGDRALDTSTGLNEILSWPVGGQPTDEQILFNIQSGVSGLDHIAVDAGDDLWVGSYAGVWQLYDGDTGALLRTEVGLPNIGGRGGFVDSDGVQVSAGPRFLRWDTVLPLAANIDPLFLTNVRRNAWGTAKDLDGNYWVTEDWSGTVDKYAPDGAKLGTFYHGEPWAQGITVGKDGHIWVAHSHCGYTVGHLLPDGTWLGNVLVANHGPTEVSVDRKGRVWVVSTTGVVERINPLGGPLGKDGATPLGEVDVRSPNLGGTLWTFGNFVGNRNSLVLDDGEWRFAYDGKIAGSAWGPVQWNAFLYNDASVLVEVALSDDGVNYGAWQTLTLASPVPAGAGRYLRGRVTLTPATTGESPALYDLTVGTQGYAAPEPPRYWRVSAGEDIDANWPDTIQLKGAFGRSDHAFPVQPTYQWSLVSFTPLPAGSTGTAPAGGVPTFSDPTDPRSTVTFNGVGDYVLRLTATLEGVVSTDEVRLHVTPFNKTPYVSAGETVYLRDAVDSVTLSGTARDDGLPLPANLTLQWEKLFGPGTVTFTAPTSTVTDAKFSAPGIYVLRLTGNDGEFSHSSTVTAWVGLVCRPEAPSGIVSWWQANGDGADHVGGNQAFAENGAGYIDGRVGPAFNFDGINDRFLVFGNPSLDVGAATGAGFAFEFWVRPTESREATILQYGRNATTSGFTIRQSAQNLVVNYRETSGLNHEVTIASGLPLNTWTHVSINYDRASGIAAIHRNGGFSGTWSFGAIAIDTRNDLRLGGNWANAVFFKGQLDEITVYDRALSLAETYQIYASAASGKRPPTSNVAPTIQAGPAGGYILLGSARTLTLQGEVTDDDLPHGLGFRTKWSVLSAPVVTTSPLVYATVAFADMTSPTSPATFSHPGLYTLQLEAEDGAACSRRIIDVRVAAEGTKAPAGLVAWWPANYSTDELVRRRTEPGVGVAYQSGYVGAAYSFAGNGSHVVAQSAAGQTNLGAFAKGFTMEFWVQDVAGGQDLFAWVKGTTRQARWLLTYDWTVGNYLEFSVGSHVLRVGLLSKQWQHVALTYDRPSGVMRAYLDGRLRSTWSITAAQQALLEANTTGDVYFGWNPSGSTINAKLDETSFYDRPLSHAEVIAIHQQGAAGKAPDIGNIAPVVNAGPDQILMNAGGASSLAGAVADDGLPTGAVRAEWKQLFGPATVALGDAGATATTATFPAAGIYGFRLSATDGHLVSSDTMEVRVAGAGLSVPTGLVAWWPGNYSSEEVMRGRIEPTYGVGYQAGQVGGAYSFTGTLGHMLVPAVPGQTNLGAFAQGFTMEFWIRDIAGGQDVFAWLQGTARQARWLLTYEWTNTSYYLDFAAGSSSWRVGLLNKQWQHVALTYDKGSATMRGYLDGRLQRAWTITAAQAAAIATGTDGDIYVGWSPASGPLNASLDELSFYDRPLGQSEVIALYNQGAGGKAPVSANTAPMVDAGPDIALTATSGVVALSGSISDDGLPGVGLSTQWTQLFGPATATITGAGAQAAQATLPSPGIYGFKLAASDGLLSASDTTEVRVAKAGVAAPAGLVAWWPANYTTEEAVRDRIEPSIGQAYQAGNVGGAYSFTASGSHVVAPATQGQTDIGRFANGFTMEYWVRDNGSDNRDVFAWVAPSGRQARWFFTYDWTRGNDIDFVVGANTWRVGLMNKQWQHVALCYDKPAGILKGYMDGRLKSTWTISAAQRAEIEAATSGDVYFGWNAQTVAFKGALDEISFYDRPLSMAEVMELYNQGTSGKAPLSGNEAPSVDAGPDISIPAAIGVVTLRGWVEDDGLPGGSLVKQWTQLFGPAQAVISDTSSPQPQVTLPVAGIYGFKLAASDGLLATADTVEVRSGTSGLSAPSGLVAWWPGNYTTEELVRDRIESSIGLGYQAGRAGGAYNFTGSASYVVVPAVPGQTNLGAFVQGFTMEFWIRNGGSNQELFAWSKDGAAQNRWVMSYDWTKGYFLEFLTGSSSLRVGLLNGQWQHVALTYDRASSVLRGYLNGSLQATWGFTEAQRVALESGSTGDLYLGWRPNGPSFNGGLDELSFYDRALPQSDIQAIFNAGIAGKTPLSRAPEVEIVAPQVGEVLAIGTLETFLARVRERTFPIASVAFYDGNTLLGQVTAPRLELGSSAFALEAPISMSVGSHVLTAVVTDSAGLWGASAPVAITVTYGPPVVSLIAPVATESVAALLPLTLRANASYDGGPIAKVEFFAGSTKLGESTAPDSETGDYLLTMPAGLAAGAHSLTAKAVAADGASRVSASVDIVSTLVAPVVALTAPADGAAFLADRPLTLTAEATVSAGSVERVEFYNGTILLGVATAPESSSPSSFALNIPAGLPAGAHVLTARAIAALSGATTTSPPVSVAAAPYAGPEVVELSTPLDGDRITAPTEFTGIVARAGLASWKLEYRLTPSDPEASDAIAPWTAFASGTDYVGTPAAGSTPAAPATLGALDPTLLLNGLHQVRLSAASTNGTAVIAGPVGIIVEGNMKVGAFSVAFNDLVEQTPGLPITLTRTYDSRDRRVGDFGPGWHLSLGNVRVQKNRHLGNGWWQTPQSGDGIQFYDVLPIDDRIVTVVMPDGETHRFRAGAYVKNRVGDPDHRSFARIVRDGSCRFYPVGDTTSTLEPIVFDGTGEPVLADRFWIDGTGDQNLYAGEYGDWNYEPYNPTRFRLTTTDGTVVLLDQTLGLLELRDRNGNRLVINRHPGADGEALAGRIESVDSILAHEAGPITRTIGIHRRADGRIDYITDLAGRTLDYLYDPQGRLSSFTDREDNTTQFRYERSDAPSHPLFHYLTKIVDPRGLPALRCEYDDAGRLRKQIDADGRETVFDRGIDPASGRYERITDRLGHPTTYFYDERGNIRTKIDALEAVTTYDYYPDSDRVKFEEDHYGNVKGFAYDARGNVTVEILGASRSEEPATATTGYITRTSYTSFGAPLAITDPDGRVQSFSYDPATQQLLTHTVGQLAAGAHPEIEAAAPATTTYTYHPDGTLWTVTDALGNVTTTTYDYGYSDAAYPGAVKCVVTTVVDPAGAPGSDPANATATTLRTTYAYHDAQENLLATVTPRTLADGSVESVPTRHVYDAENRLRFTLLPDGRISETRYTSFGQTEKTLEWPAGTKLAALIAASPSGPTSGARVTAFAYDARGNLERTTQPDGTTTATGYDLEGRPVWRQDARGYRTFTVYDEVGRPRYTVQPDADDGTFNDAPATADDSRLANNPRAETIYDLVGRVRFQIDEEGATTEFTYEDDCGCAMRRKEMIQHHPAGNLVTTYAYYPSGQVRSVTDPRLNTTGTRYDSHSRPVRTLLPATDEHPATETSTTYNLLGQRVAVADQEGKLTRHRHDGLGRLVEVRQYLDQAIAASDTNYQLPITHSHVVATTFAYDEAGNQIAQTDARNHTTRYEHDALGRRLKRTLPATTGAAKFESLRYDNWGDLWQRDDFAGRTTTFGYDELHRLRSKQADAAHPSLAYSHAIARVEYDYDDNGAREAARTYNAAGALLHTEGTPRDERGRLNYKDTGATLLDYDYYANGLLKDIVSSTSGGVNLGYRYDELNRLEYVDDASRGLPVCTTSYAYNANGSLEAFTHANGLRHAYRYDSLNRLRHLDVGTGLASGTTVTSVLQSYDYRLRASGHRREIVETGTTAPSRTVNYGYDELYRLTGETITGDPLHSGGVGYTLDKVGNREARTSTLEPVAPVAGIIFNARDQLSTDDYDANGNTTVGQTAGTEAAPAVAEVYDFEDRLIVRTRADLSKVYLAYDADGIRIAKTIHDASAQVVSATSYLVCTNNLTGYAQVLEERKADAGGTTLKTYTYGSDLISVSESSTSTFTFNTRYYAYDGGGSVRALVDESGTVTDRYTYDAFGVLLARQGGSENAYLYRGEQYDSDLGLYSLRARFYNPDSGRFWNQDTYEGSNSDPASLHKYLYAHANPVAFLDPSGYATIPGLTTASAVLGNIVRIAIPHVARLHGAALYNIYRGVMAAEKAALIAEYVGVGVGLIGLVATGADAIAGALLNNSEPIGDGPYPEQFKRGGQIERIANPNLGGNVSIIDDLDADGIGTSLRSHNIPSGEKALLEAIQNDAREVSRAPKERIYGTTSDGRWVDFRPGTVKGTALVVAIPENDVRITLSPSFRAALRSYRETYRTAIQVIPVRGWRR